MILLKPYSNPNCESHLVEIEPKLRPSYNLFKNKSKFSNNIKFSKSITSKF